MPAGHILLNQDSHHTDHTKFFIFRLHSDGVSGFPFSATIAKGLKQINNYKFSLKTVRKLPPIIFLTRSSE